MLQFLIIIDLKSNAKFHENPIKMLPEQAIWNLTFAARVRILSIL